MRVREGDGLLKTPGVQHEGRTEDKKQHKMARYWTSEKHNTRAKLQEKSGRSSHEPI